jgi:hypothetical protein
MHITITEQDYKDLMRVKRNYERLCHLLQPVLRIVPAETKRETDYREPAEVFVNFDER